jgi:hypothetical protein
MKRTILGVFFLLAACGGDLRNDSGAVNRSAGSDARATREGFLMTQAAHDVIAQFARSVSQDALDTCLNAYVDDGGPSDQVGPVIKPTAASLRAFLSSCLNVPVPADLRRDVTGADTRTAQQDSIRSQVTAADLRSTRPDNLRSASDR